MNNIKKFQKIFFEICFSIFAVFLLSFGIIRADDDPSYSINKLNINCKIEKDGSLQLTRTVTYNFSDDAHGLTYQQELPKDNSKYSIQKVEIANGNGHFQNVTKSDSHKNDTYSVSDNDLPDVFLIKTYHKIKSGQQVTVKYVFTMADAITNYRDAARLNYKVIGFDTDVPQKNVNITFDFGKKNLKLLKAWVHADVNPQKQVSAHNGTVNIKIKKLPANDDVEADILFPTSITSQNPNVSKRKIIQSTINLEKKIIRDNRIRLFKKYLLIPLIIIFYAVIRLIIGIVKIKKYNILSMPEIPHNFEIPNISVGTADAFFAQMDSKSFWGKSVDKNHAFTGQLLQLHNQKEISIKHEQNDYVISIINNELVKEGNIFDILFNTVGDGKQFTIGKLKELVEENDKDFAKKITNALTTWFDDYTQPVEKEDVNAKANFLFINNYFYLIGTFTILGIWWFFNQSWSIFSLALITFIIALLTLNIYRNKVPFNSNGLTEYLKIAGFKKMLLEIGNFKESKFNDLILWKDILPFAVGFNISKEVLKKLKQSFTEAELLQTFNADDYFYFYDDNYFDDEFSSDLDSFLSTASSSDSSSSSDDNDSFSSGDSGGFGGDSGDGAF